jgi:proprotein convertase subtilisin/kexin type 5
MGSCYTCNSSNTCLTCNIAQNRIFNTSTQGCDCKVGYYQPSTSTNTCMLCSSNCVTCQYSSYYCTSCNYTLNRVLNTNSNTCVCRSGYN